MLRTAKRERLSQYVSLRTELSTKASGSWTKTRKMAEEFKFGQMDPDMMDSGETEWPMATEDSSMPKEMSTRANGLRIRLKAMVSTHTSTAAGTRDNGSRISSTDLVSSNGPMEPSTRVNMSKE